MKEFIKQHWRKIAAAIATGIIATLTALFSSCSSIQKINVKQEQDGQMQETTIESNTTIKELTFIFTHDGVTEGQLGESTFALTR